MKLTRKDKSKKCRVCGCTVENPCPKNFNKRTCRMYPWKVDSECAFCTNPVLKGGVARIPRLIIRTPRFDTHHVQRTKSGWRVELSIPQLRVDGDKRPPRFIKQFSDAEYGGKTDALFEAVIWRDRILGDLGMGPKSAEIVTMTVTTIETVTKIVTVNVQDVDYPRQGLITNRTSMQELMKRETERINERHRVRPNHDGVSRSLAAKRWAVACSSGQVQMSTQKKGKGKW